MYEDQLLLPCLCAGTCSILGVDVLIWDDDTEPEDIWFEIYQAYDWSRRLRERVKMAIKLVLGKEHYARSTSLRRDGAEEMRDFLNRYLEYKKENSCI